MKVTDEQKEILDKIPAMVSINDKEHRVVWMNQYALKITKKRPKDIIGRSLIQIFPEQGELYAEENNQIFQTGKPLLNRVYKMSDDISNRWYHVDKIPLTNENGDVIYVLVFLLDYSDHIRDIQERVNSEFKYRALFDSSPESVTITDMSGTVMDFNQKTLRLLELTEDDVWDENLLDLITINEKDKDNYNCLIRRVLNGEPIDPIELNIKVGSNKSKEKIVEVFPAVLKKVDQPFAIQVISRDVTKQKEAERALRESERREAEERLKAQKLESIGILAGGIAHDFNNIMTGILGNLSLAELDLDNANEDVKEAFNGAKIALRQARDLTQELLTFSKGGSPIKESVLLPDLIRNNAKFVLRGSKCKAKFDLPSNLWQIYADKSQIAQVLSNIFINAMQAMPDGGLLQITAENLRLKADMVYNLKSGLYVKVSIHDQGIGIPEKYLQKIFDPYFTTKEKGSGLGLATSYSIIKKHGGHIEVQSELGVGSTFNIYLPAATRINTEQSEQKNALIPGKGRILVMDDDNMVRQVLEKLLARLGYEASLVKYGRIAISEYKISMESNNKFDAVIMDLTIAGGWGGKKTINVLRKIDPDVRAIVSSGYSNDTVMSNYVEFGFSGVVKKPYQIDELSHVLAEVLNGNK